MIAWLAYLCASFLSGSIPFGYILAKRRGVDITTVGSGNIGATNTARVLGKKLGAVVLLLDALKAFLPTWLVLRFAGALPQLALPGLAEGAIGLAAIVGHVFSPWMRFKGGKGVAPSLGVFLVLAPAATGIATAVWVIFYTCFRIASLGSLIASLILVLAMVWRHAPSGYLAVVIATFLLVVFRHTENIQRLLAKREGKV
jgi:glycerol-3-phosphate acyltransferase PlsY